MHLNIQLNYFTFIFNTLIEARILDLSNRSQNQAPRRFAQPNEDNKPELLPAVTPWSSKLQRTLT